MTSEEEANPELESSRLLAASAQANRRLYRNPEATAMESPVLELRAAAAAGLGSRDSPATGDAKKEPSVEIADAGDVRWDERWPCGCFAALPCCKRRQVEDDQAAAAAANAAVAATAAACIARPRFHRPSGLSELAGRTRFSREELRRLYRGFKNDCPAGLVRRDAFREIFCQFFPLGDATAYADLVFNSLLPPGEEAAVTFDAAVIALSAMCRGDAQERVSWAFRICDADKDGRLTRREVAGLVSAVYDLLGPSVLPRVAPDDVQRHADAVFRRMLLSAGRDADLTETVEAADEVSVTLAEFSVDCRQGRDIDREFACFETVI